MNDFVNSGKISVGGSMVVGDGNTISTGPEQKSQAARFAPLASVLAAIRQAAPGARLPGPVLAAVVESARDAQRCLDAGNPSQVGVALLRGYVALDAPEFTGQAANLKQMLESAASMARQLDD